MGACWNLTSMDGGLTERELKRKFSALVDEAAWDSGHGGYTGTWAECDGLTVIHKNFTNPAEAEKWLEETAEKWGPAIAVRADGEWVIGAWCSS